MDPNIIFDSPFKLSKNQIDIIKSESSYIKILAGAGAGKTETMARKIVYHILINKINPENIVTFTFTNRAANNLRQKVYELIKEYTKDDTLLHELDKLNISTIHSYVKSLLDKYFDYDNYTLLNQNQEFAFLLENSKRLDIESFSRRRNESVLTFYKTYNMVCNEMLDIIDLKNNATRFYNSYDNYKKLLNDYKLLTFSSIFEILFNKLKDDKSVLKDIKYLFVDEFQDINQSQYNLIKIISEYSNVIIVGDKRQTIYQWRGSNQKFFDQFEKDYDSVEVFTLDSNYRSNKNIVENANKFVKYFKDGNYNAMLYFNEKLGAILTKNYDNEKDESKEIVDTISYLKKSHSLEYNDMAILLRSMNYSKNILKELKNKKIPYIVGGESGLFNRDEIIAMALIFTWFSDNVDYEYEKNTLKGNELVDRALQIWDNIVNIDIKIARFNLNLIKSKIHEKDSYANITELYQVLLKNLNINKLDYKKDNDNLVLSNLGQFNVLLTDYETASKFHGNSHRLETLINGLTWYIKLYAKNHYSENIEINTDLNVVFVSTVHQAKGLEWSVVFLPSLTDKRFPNSLIGREQNWCDIPRNLFDVERYEGSLEDEKKLFYVAITRPKNVLIFSHYNKELKSKFLDELNISLCKDFKNELDNLKFDKSNNNNYVSYDVTDLLRYNRCGYMYLFRNIYGFQPGIKEQIGFGNTLHYCLKEIVKMVRNGLDINTAVARSVDTDFNLPFAGEKTLFNLKNNARVILSEFCNKHSYIIKNTKEEEFKVSYMLEDTIITGKLDSIISYNNKDIIVDYKTNKDVGTKDEFNMQLNLYFLGLNHRKRISEDMIAYLTENETENSEVNEATMEDTKVKIKNIIQSIENKNYIPKDKYCKNCDVKKICRYNGELNGES